jgi:hypothetical protein
MAYNRAAFRSKLRAWARWFGANSFPALVPLGKWGSFPLAEQEPGDVGDAGGLVDRKGMGRETTELGLRSS